MTYLRPLKNIELRDIFRTLDRNNKGSIDVSDLAHAYTLLGSPQEDLSFALDHLVKVSSNYSTPSTPIHADSSYNLANLDTGNYNNIGRNNTMINSLDSHRKRSERIELTAFVDAVNHIISTNSLEALLRSTFDRLSASNSSTSDPKRVIRVSDLLDLSAKFGLKMSKDSEIRLQARIPDQGLDFNGFVQLVANT